MPVRIITADCTVSGMAGNCAKADKAVLGHDWSSNNGREDDVSTVRTALAYTPTVGISISGVLLFLRRNNANAGTVTVRLLENGTIRATASFSATTLPEGSNMVRVTFGTPHTTAANTYQIQVQNTLSGVLWSRSATASDYSYATIDNSDTATGYVSGDTLLIAPSYTLTVDQSVTLAPVGLFSAFVGNNSTLTVPNPAAPITIALGTGLVGMSCMGSTWRIGTSSTPVAAGRVTITCSAPLGSMLCYGPVFPYNGTNASAVNTLQWEFFGVAPDSTRVHVGAPISAGANTSGQAKVSTASAIPGSWVATDSLQLFGKEKVTDASTHAISSIDGSGLELTMNSNLDAALVTGGWVLNVSEVNRAVGIRVQSTNMMQLGYPYSYTNLNSCHHMTMKGVYLTNVQPGMPAAQFAPNVFDGVYFSGPAQGFSVFNLNGYYVGSTFNNIFVWSPSGSIPTAQWLGTGMTVTNAGVKNMGSSISNSAGWLTVASSFTDIVLSNYLNTSVQVYLGGYNNTYTDFRAIGAGMHLFNLNDSRFVRLLQRGHLNHGLVFGDSVQNTFTDCTFGSGSTNTGNDIFVTTNAYVTAFFNNCSVGSKGIGNYLLAVAGSFLQFLDYLGVSGDHRTWKTRGTFTSPSPYTTLVQRSESSVYTLSHRYALLTEVVAGKEHALVIVAQIANAAYFGTPGSFDLPKVNIYADGNTTTPAATLTLAASTAEQTVAVSFTPALSGKQVLLEFVTRTNAAAANANVTWSRASVVQRIYGQAYAQVDLGITDALTYPIASLPTPLANSFITESSAAVVATYTGIAINHDLRRVTITVNRTLQELYDYVQRDLTLTANLDVPEWFTTVDGTTYASEYDIYVGVAGTPGIVLSGQNTIIINEPNDFVSVNGGYFSGTYIDQDGTFVPLLLTGLVAGSTVQIYDVTAAAELYNAVVSATSLNLTVEYNPSNTIRVRVRKPGYLAYEYSGFLAPTGLTLSIAQTVDAVYVANGIDGGAVLDFSFDGASIYIFLESPYLTSGQALYNWWQHSAAQTSYIGGTPDILRAITQTQYRISGGVRLSNLDTSTAIEITGCNLTTGTGSARELFDPYSGPIFVNAATVEPTNPLTTAQETQLFAGLTKAQFIGLGG